VIVRCRLPVVRHEVPLKAGVKQKPILGVEREPGAEVSQRRLGRRCREIRVDGNAAVSPGRTRGLGR
jgi:hypothetical protein